MILLIILQVGKRGKNILIIFVKKSQSMKEALKNTNQQIYLKLRKKITKI